MMKSNKENNKKAANKNKVSKVLFTEKENMYGQIVEHPIDNNDNEENEHIYPSKDELAGVKNYEEEIEKIKHKCKFKQEYVDQKVILSVNHLKQYFVQNYLIFYNYQSKLLSLFFQFLMK